MRGVLGRTASQREHCKASENCVGIVPKKRLPNTKALQNYDGLRWPSIRFTILADSLTPRRKYLHTKLVEVHLGTIDNHYHSMNKQDWDTQWRTLTHFRRIGYASQLKHSKPIHYILLSFHNGSFNLQTNNSVADN